jgi:Ser/Thr protein kinase RdoA (MazF antagonist)
MVTDGRTLAEIEGYVERCPLDELEKAGLWMLAWAHQDQATQLRVAKETLALASSMA